MGQAWRIIAERNAERAVFQGEQVETVTTDGKESISDFILVEPQLELKDIFDGHI